MRIISRLLVVAGCLLCCAGVQSLALSEPSTNSVIGDVVFNPMTGTNTTVSGLVKDPSGTPTAGNIVFVKTSDGHVFFVRQSGDIFYNSDTPPVAYTVSGVNTNSHTAEITRAGVSSSVSINTRVTEETFNSYFSSDTPGVDTPAVIQSGVNGVKEVRTGKGGSNGHDGALVVSPASGGNGATGPSVNLNNSTTVSTASGYGIQAGSIGGNGGQGGDSYLSFWSGKDGGDGGAGGLVDVFNQSGVQVATTGADHHGIFAYSRSGEAGNGGDGWAAPGGGTGGHSSNGGTVGVRNAGNITTTGYGSFGIYGLSVSGNGGTGGSQWGLVGKSGSGGYGGSGGSVSVANLAEGTIRTTGSQSHGIFAQSVGGSGGSSGTSGNLILSLQGDSDNGGNGGSVEVSNAGYIDVQGAESRGIFAQSIGGGGGAGGTSGGLVALGGSGSNGGSAGTVSAANTGVIKSTADGIFAQSVGGSGGSGSFAGGLVSVGGSGSKAGNGSQVTVRNTGTISTTGDKGRGIVAQSIGGGGGDGGSSGGLVAVGGSGNGGGHSGTVSVLQGGTITTKGDESTAVFAQSVGGGGGNGGSAGSVSAFIGVAVGGSGGGGGAGGAVNVSVQGKDADNASVIHTEGDRSDGIFAQSVGGGGGNGGGAVQVTGGYIGAVSIAVGGSGGDGGNGGNVVMTKGAGQSIVETDGADSKGVLLQSVGGGGGNGGFAVAVALSGGDTVSGSLSVGVGGSGGSGGDGGRVNVGAFDGSGSLTSSGFNGSVLTKGERSAGFIAQSIGGGGGNGGLAVSAAGSGAGAVAVSVAVGVGGAGGSGGTGGDVSAGLEGNIATEGNNSSALLVQSVGGGGGNGGGSISGAVSGSGAAAGSVGLSVGGSGGNGNTGGNVIAAARAGEISSKGDNSTGVTVQSIGGGGGTGGYSLNLSVAGSGTGAGAVSVGLGGSGGTGSDAGTVRADLQSDVFTEGENSSGVLVQSVGGGGGTGGFNIGLAGSGSGTGSGSVGFSLGGSGGAAGDGNEVTATSTGTIVTKGDRSAGFIAQSIGGGGGNGGFSAVGSLSGAGTGSGAISVGLGGSGAGGGESGRVIASATGPVFTGGNSSQAILAQSVGGGGGNGGFNVNLSGSGAGTGSGVVSLGLGGNGGAGSDSSSVDLTVAVTNTILTTGSGADELSYGIATLGDNSTAVTAQSIGGGGGNGGFNVSVAGSGAGTGSGSVGVGLGGGGDGGGDGDRVMLDLSGSVYTAGDNSGGVLAQSVGGGGGSGGFNVSAALSGGGTGSGAVGVGLGGDGAGGGNGGSVVASTAAGRVTTAGDNSVGILAQSVGGGGGSGGFNVDAAFSAAETGSGAVSVGLGGSGAGGGSASAVDLTVDSDVNTFGNSSAAVVAQSVGGGGGNGGFNVSVSGSGAGEGSGTVGVGLGGSGGGGGDADRVTLGMTGDLLTQGDGSAGLIAQSVGGGGGNGGFNVTAALNVSGQAGAAASVGLGGSGGDGGNGGMVVSDLIGDVVTRGGDSGGVLAQSLGGGGGNGGINISGSLSAAKTASGAVSVGLGGSGGGGGDSAAVGNSVTGDVVTDGADSAGVVAQSLGGGGGNGGLNISGAVSLSSDGAGALAVGLGGSGGSGGDAGRVTNRVAGWVQTAGDHSAGIIAQSLGGGGGNGALNVSGTLTASKTQSGGLAVGIGGFGGDGGDASDVRSSVTGGVSTGGDDSVAVLAQSQGGGGGNGAVNVTGSVNLSKEGGGAIGVGVGGFGGNGGNAGDVSSAVVVTEEGSRIITSGDNSSAVVAQSMGGGGGNGGANVTGTVNLTGKSGASIGVGVGGFGGGGGDAGNVDLDVIGDVVTLGDDSNGLLAQSVGGGGGNGGVNVSGALALTSGDSGTAYAAAIGVGGFGGSGGEAGDVTASYEGAIAAQPGSWVSDGTDPDTGDALSHFELNEDGGSHGLVAQSLGGGGGNGGVNVSGGLSLSKSGQNSDGKALLIGVGGFGGAGGDAGDVAVNITGTNSSISAFGDGKSALLAQSLGGGGGNGAVNVTGGITSDASLMFGVGGSGGDAGVAKSVAVNAVADVYAAAAGSNKVSAAGILAQSIGGGGGNGALNVTGGVTLNKESGLTDTSVTFGIGGAGGSGSVSGDVMVDHSGNAVAKGDWVHGILAQSIAGGGGNGGMNVSGQINLSDSSSSGGNSDIAINAGIGGSAGSGADAGDVLVIQNGVVQTEGDYARGVFAQSVGGGGGTGGMNVTASYSKQSSPISVGIGGSGSGGGNAGSVRVIRGAEGVPTGTISTDGSGAHGIEASSIGGGGGDAGMNFVLAYSGTGSGNSASNSGFAAQFSVGGSGGEAGNGATASVENYSDIVTAQKDSHGILAQSIGGGGGNATYNIAKTYASGSSNAPTKAINIAIGGGTGDGGNGNEVDVVQGGWIETTGDRSYGILAQSIGGGGGNVGMDQMDSTATGMSLGFTLGQQGGSGGSGGDVSLASSGTVMTHGEGSFGLLAQSLGNGGGNSSATSASFNSGGSNSVSAAVSVGATGSSGGRGGDVMLTAAGRVSTEGTNTHAIIAQSIGGGGGNGAAATTGASTLSVGLGGVGGSGGVGGAVSVMSSADVRTAADGSIGILAQSIGGGGGNGGASSTKGASKGKSVSAESSGAIVNIGGSGGSGMSSDRVAVSNDGVIITQGKSSHGILAQSLGGGGGNSGTVTSRIGGSEKNTNSVLVLNVAVGGEGGTGGIGGAVSVTNRGGIGTCDARSIGILAQSIGGGGGNADTVMTGISSGKSGGGSLSVAIGGTGGIGGTAGDVTVRNLVTVDDADSGQIITLGDAAHGIMASSIGGGGGMGSTVITAGSSGSSTSSTARAFSFNLGGTGGSGGTGGDVLVENQSLIETHGAGAHGILAQSIGGGGGTGGSALSGDFVLGSSSGSSNSPAAFSMALGGTGGDGNTSGQVVVNNSGTIDVSGDGSCGIYAQSVGGGGGDGGFAATLSRNLLTNPKTDLGTSLMNIGLGGAGGSGADSGDVRVDHSGTIYVRGNNSYGIFAQSVSGGGGNAGFELTSPVWMAADLALSAVLGSREGDAGTAGAVTVNSTGDIFVLGTNSQAQLTQSVNGGGGNVDLFLDVSQQAAELDDTGADLPAAEGSLAGVKAALHSYIGMGGDALSGAIGSVVDSTHLGDVFSRFSDADAVTVQSIGGGGGTANSDVVLNDAAGIDLAARLGGASLTNSSGGKITQTRDGRVETGADLAGAMSVQSIGGGGGVLCMDVQRVALTNGADEVSVPGSARATASIGADGSVSSDGGEIVLNYSGDVLTGGDLAPGLVIQSIGAGGGSATYTGLDSLNVSLGATGGSIGDGGGIALTNNGVVQTTGELSHAVVLQSIGGGGGLVLTDLPESGVTVANNTENSGNGGNIIFEQTGNVLADGDRSIGVLVQSLGGGGGAADRLFMDTAGGAGDSGRIDLILNGSVSAQGESGIGVFAQSRGEGVQGDIFIELATNQVIVFGTNGTGVAFSGGMENLLMNNGTIAGLEGLEGWAITGEEGNEFIENYGLVLGQLDLGTGFNLFENNSFQTFIPGPQLLLGGPDSWLIQNGAMIIGGVSNAQHTVVDGSFEQTAEGQTFTELDFGSANPNADGGLLDQIEASGSVILSGADYLTLLNPQLVPYGHFTQSLFYGDLGVMNNGLSLITAPSVVITYGLLDRTGTDTELDYNIDFAPSELGRNLREVGSYFNRIQAAGSTPELADVVVNLLYDPDMESYRTTLSQMSPDFYGELQAQAVRMSQSFGQMLAEGAGHRYYEKDYCLWANAMDDRTQHDRHSDYKDFEHSTSGYSFGFRKAFSEQWSAGLGFAFGDNTADGYSGNWNADGFSRYIGAGVEYNLDSTRIGATLSYGEERTTVIRNVNAVTPVETSLERDMRVVGAMLHASHPYETEHLYLQPAVELGTTYLVANDESEQGADALNLELESINQMHVWVRPSLEAGCRLPAPWVTDWLFKLYGRVSLMQYLSNSDTEVSATLQGGPSGVGVMSVPIEMGQSQLQSVAGIELKKIDGLSVRFQYSQSADEVNLRRFDLLLSIPF